MNEDCAITYDFMCLPPVDFDSGWGDVSSSMATIMDGAHTHHLSLRDLDYQ